MSDPSLEQEEPWIQMQKKTFTNWVNTQLAPMGIHISDIYTEMCNGINLIHLLDAVFHDHVYPNYNKNPKFSFHCGENVKPCFTYLTKNKKMRLVNIGPMDIVNGNAKLTLALIFNVILMVQVDNIEVDGLKGKHGLLLWVNRQIEPYGEQVTDFKESWRNGKAFAALSAALCNNVDFKKEKTLPQAERHGNAYDAFNRDLKVSKLLDPADFEQDIDDNSVVTYVSSIFNAATSGDESRKHVESIDKVAQLAMKHKNMIRDYEAHANALKKDVDKQTEYFNKTEPKVANDCRRLVKELEEYRKQDKNDLLSRKSGLEGELSDIHTSEKNESRPLYVPPPELGPNDFSQQFRDLEEAEDDFEKRLLQKFKWFLFVESLQGSLDRKCDRLKNRLNNNINAVDKKDLGESVAETQEKLHQLDIMCEEDAPNALQMTEIDDLLSQIPEEFENKKQCEKRVAEVKKLNDDWAQKRDAQRALLENNLDKQRELEKLEKDMVEHVETVNEKLDRVEELIDKCNTEDAFETAEAENATKQARDELQKVKEHMSELQQQQNQLMKEGKEDAVQQHPLQPIKKRIDDLEHQLSGKEEELGEKKKQDEICSKALAEFDVYADKLQQYVADNTQEVNDSKSMPVQDRQSLIEKKIADYRRPPEEYKRMKKEEDHCRQIGTSTSPFGPINNIWTEYGRFLDRNLDKVKDEQERAKREVLTDEEEKAMKRIMRTLDPEGNGLTIDQFREALQAMGVNISFSDLKAMLAKMGYNVGPNLRLNLDDLKRFFLELKATKNNKEDIQNSWKYLAKNKEEITTQEVDRYFKGQKSYDYLKESLPTDARGMCDYKKWTDRAFKH